jgi:hypothetical protein
LAALERLTNVGWVVALPSFDQRKSRARLIEKLRRRGEHAKTIALMHDLREPPVGVEAADEPDIRLGSQEITPRRQRRMSTTKEGDTDFC